MIIAVGVLCEPDRELSIPPVIAQFSTRLFHGRPIPELHHVFPDLPQSG